MRNIGLKVRMALAVGVILFTYGLIMNYVIALVSGGATLADPFWLLVLAATTCVCVVITYLAGITSILNSREDMVSSGDFPELASRAEELSAKMGIERPAIAFERMGVPSAYAVGRRGNGYVVLSVELLENLTVDEIECVMAHEFAHLRNRDSIITVIGTTITKITGWIIHGTGLAVGFVTYMLVKIVRRWTGNPYYPGLPAHQRVRIKRLATSVRDVVTAFLTIFLRTLSRQREYIADETAAKFTGKPEAMQSALRKVGSASSNSSRRANAGNDGPDHTDIPDALCIHSEFSGSFKQLFSTHPSIDSRISRLDRIQSTESPERDSAHHEPSGTRPSRSEVSPSGTARGTVVSATKNGRAAIRTDIADDGVFHLSGLGSDLSAGETVLLSYPDSVRNPSASDITDVRTVEESDEPDVVSAPGVVESVTNSRIAVRTELASDGLFYLSGIQANLSSGDTVRLYYDSHKTDPSASDIKYVRPVEST